jgi:hypothetical protein
MKSAATRSVTFAVFVTLSLTSSEQPVFAADNKLDAIVIVSPAAIAIPLTSGHGSVEVFYRLKTDVAEKEKGPVAVSLTSIGSLKPGVDIIIAEEDRTDPIRKFRIDVDTNVPLKVGEAQTGRVIFKQGLQVDDFPLTITRVAPATFTVNPEKFDICVDCGDGDPTFAIRVENTGLSSITSLKISSLTIEDAGTQARMIYPEEEKDREPERTATEGSTPASADTATVAGTGTQTKTGGQTPAASGAARAKTAGDVVELTPGGEATGLTIAPGGSLTIHLKLTLPRKAGAYSGTIQVSANGSERKAVQMTLRTRGPNGWRWCPLILFILTLFAGALAAKVLEHFYGSGGGLTRARALLSLEASRTMVVDILHWLEQVRAPAPGTLPITQKIVESDLREIEKTLGSADELKPAELDARATVTALRAAKRRALQNAALRANDDANTLKRFDAVSADGTLEAYEAALEGALAGPVDLTETAADSSAVKSGKPPIWKAKLAFWLVPRFRYVVWLIVTFAAAYTTFYANHCSFGTLVDYLTVFLWALGLTTAGFAVIGETRSSYTPPA